MPGFESGHEDPKYIAFRLSENGGYLAVVAALDPDDTVRFPWATWYHEQAPQGQYQKAPADYARLLISPELAIAMVDLIKARRALPPDFVATLPIVY